MFEQEFDRGSINTDFDSIEPAAEFSVSPRDHIDTPRPSKLGWFGTILLLIIATIIIVSVLGFGIVFIQQRQERLRKRFY